MNNYGLVLAGGGSKGAYQLGAWKAMQELGITFEAIAGVSIGGVNGALISMGDFSNALSFWNNIGLDKGVNISEPLPDPDNLFSAKNFPILFKEVLKNGGFDASPAKNFFNEYVDEKKIRQSGIRLGLVTVEMSNGLNPVEIFCDQIPEGQLVDYLLASADIPLAINVGPEGGRFLDGGAYDNTPIQFMRKNGYNRLVVVDIATIKGLAHNPRYENCEIVYIRPYDPEELGASFDFSAKMNEKRILLGYYDTKKAFSCLLGNIYYFSPDVFREMIKKHGADTVKQLEELAHKLKLPNLKIYTESEFIAELKKLYEIHKEQIIAEEAEKAKKQAEKEKKKAEREHTENDKKGIVPSVIEKIVNSDNDNAIDKIVNIIEKISEEPSSENPRQRSDDEKKKGHISSILNIISTKHKGENEFTLAKNFLENFS